jgi:glycine/D-amino acid oxidase-like deaminating enzyme
MQQTSYWKQTSQAVADTSQLLPKYDVIVIGAGITGVTAAYFLQKKHKQVLLIDRLAVGDGETGNSSAMITCLFDASPIEIRKKHGEAMEKAIWDVGSIALETIKQLVSEEQLACGFTRCPSFLYAQQEKDLSYLKAIYRSAKKHGVTVDIEYSSELPIAPHGYVILNDEAKFNPAQYVCELTQRFLDAGGHLRQQLTAEAVEKTNVNGGDMMKVKTGTGDYHTRDVIVATHYPFTFDLPSTAKLDPQITYILRAEIPPNYIPDANYFDTGQPYNYFRIEKGVDRDVILIGGSDHRSGQTPDDDPYKPLEDYIRTRLGIEKFNVTHRWNGEVLETIDVLPFIGEYRPHQYVATGYFGNGITFGTYAGVILASMLVGQDQALYKAYAPHRMGSIGSYLQEGVTNATEFIKKGAEKLAGKKRPTCSHMGCLLEWNTHSNTWDCPCHGSRFTDRGEVLSGPAVHPLNPSELQ